MPQSGIRFYISSPRSPLLLGIARRAFTASHRTRLYRKLAKLMKNGVQLQGALENLQRRIAKKSETDIQAVALGDILREYQAGRGFSAAITQYASTNERMVLDAGEKSGDLPSAMELAADILDAQKQMRGQVISAVAQPIFLMIMLLVVILAVSKFVIPKLTAVLDPSEWSSIAYGLYQFTEVVNSPWFLVVLFLIFCGIVAVVFSLPLWKGRGRAAFDKIPPWSMFRLLVGSGWILSLASLVQSGETILNSLQSMRNLATRGRVGNPWLRDRLNKAIFYITSGYNLGEALEATKTGFPDQEIVEDLATFAELEGFEDILYNLGNEWVTTGLERIKQQATVLNTAAMLLIACVLGWFTFAVVSIQMSLGSHFSGIGM